MKTAFLYNEKFASFNYGANHPMRPVRLKLTHDLIEALGLFDIPDSRVVEGRRATDEELLLFHTPDYIRVLKEADGGMIPVEGPSHGLGYGDNPVFRGVFEWSSYTAGASVQAASLVAGGEADVAFNISGGLHHAMPSRASGFCYINDPAVAIKHLVRLGRRAAYVDVDAHHGDGVEYAFYDSDRVLTISIHESGQFLFPGTGSVTDMGIKAGEGFSVNMPLPPSTGDELYLKVFEEIVPPFIEAFSPDILVTQLGVDTFSKDPITHLDLTTACFEELIKRFRSFNVPWVALGGGGYDMSNVSRAWTLAWAAMNAVEAPGEMPGDFFEKNRDVFESRYLRDEPKKAYPLSEGALREVERDVKYLKERVLPLVKV